MDPYESYEDYENDYDCEDCELDMPNYRLWHDYHDDAGFCYHLQEHPRFDCWNPPPDE